MIIHITVKQSPGICWISWRPQFIKPTADLKLRFYFNTLLLITGASVCLLSWQVVTLGDNRFYQQYGEQYEQQSLCSVFSAHALINL